ncbi:MAG: biosynthetic-type acetolactate synthase large subunit [Planctomycetia bacterium]|nr:biosynthetic-type acetolactate synthase large subunit [Planctomycetia bacterium]
MSGSSAELPRSCSTPVRPESGAEVVVTALIRQGVDTVFAYPGACTMPLHHAFIRHQEKVRVILPRHEQGGGFAAHGYARSTGRPGVCLTTSGPGATNLVTTIADAKLDSIPVIFITGQVQRSAIGSDAFQEVPMTEICRSITKQHYLVTDVRDLARIVKEAFFIATTGRPGPVLIDIPRDVLTAQIGETFDTEDDLDRFYDPPMILPGYSGSTPEITEESIATIAKLIREAERPVICAGGGLISADASGILTRFVRQTGIPITTTLMGQGLYPEDDPLSLDFLGMHGAVPANIAVSRCDLLLALGIRFSDRVTGNVAKFAGRAKIVHVDIDPSEIAKVRRPDVAVAADAKQLLERLVEMDCRPGDQAAITRWHETIAEWKRTDPITYRAVNGWVTAQMAIDTLWRMTRNRDDVIITTGVGQHQMWTAQFFRFRRPRTWISSMGLGTMGFGLPAAIGVKSAHPEAMVIDIDGDGSFQMNIQEMATCVCEKLPVKVLLLNNQHLGMVVQWEDRFYRKHRAHTYLGPIDHPEWRGQGDGLGPADRYPNYVGIAQNYGWLARSVAHAEELDDALREMLETPGPFLLDVAVPYNEYVLPMIPPGCSVDQMIRS